MALAVSRKDVGFIGLVNNDHIIVLKNSKNKLEQDTASGTHIITCSSVVFPETASSNDGDQVSKSVDERFITSASISNCGRYITACDSKNLIQLWKITNNIWQALSARSLARKGQKVIFTNSGSEILIADRGGDVFTFSVYDFSKPGNLLLGHISLILDIAITNTDEYVITCDRDSKIRISMYPNAYNIVSYCLGHQEFVSSLQVMNLSDELLISGSGDGTLRIWEIKEGKQICCLNLLEKDNLVQGIRPDCCTNVSDSNEDNFQLSEKQTISSVQCIRYCSRFELVAVLYHSISRIDIYQLNSAFVKLKFLQSVDLKSLPVDSFFDNDGNLVVVVSSQDEPLLVFKFDNDSDNPLFVHLDNTALNDIVLYTEITKCLQEMDRTVKNDDSYKYLFKHCYGEYFDDKKSNKSRNVNPPKKKNKVE